MLIKLQSFDKGGKAEGPALIMWDDEVRFLDITKEANGGITAHANMQDEFGNETKISIHLDQIDILQISGNLTNG
jgi:hypothetical protein